MEVIHDTEIDYEEYSVQWFNDSGDREWVNYLNGSFFILIECLEHCNELDNKGLRARVIKS